MKTIILLPIVSGNGSKYLTTALANSYKELNKNKKVAIVDFDVKNPYLASSLTNDNIHGIDTLINKIDGDILTKNLFMENMIHLKNNVDLLQGTKLFNSYEVFKKNHIEEILSMLNDCYDIVFISLSSEFDNYLSACSLVKADDIFMVARNNQSTAKAFERTTKIVKNYSNGNIKTIINMYTNSNKIDISQISKKFNINIAGIVEYDENTIDNVNIGESLLGFFKTKNKNDENFKKILTNL